MKVLILRAMLSRADILLLDEVRRCRNAKMISELPCYNTAIVSIAISIGLIMIDIYIRIYHAVLLTFITKRIGSLDILHLTCLSCFFACSLRIT